MYIPQYIQAIKESNVQGSKYTVAILANATEKLTFATNNTDYE
jgi:hypothetical protein